MRIHTLGETQYVKPHFPDILGTLNVFLFFHSK